LCKRIIDYHNEEEAHHKRTYKFGTINFTADIAMIKSVFWLELLAHHSPRQLF
jgi:hypothetical protein